MCGNNATELPSCSGSPRHVTWHEGCNHIGRTQYEESGGKAGKGGARSLLDSRRLPRRLCTAAADLPHQHR
jgi:hypothetical protein